MQDRLQELESEADAEQGRSIYKNALKAWVYFTSCYLSEHDKNEEDDSEEKLKKMLDSCQKKRKRGPKTKAKKRPGVIEGKEGFEDQDAESGPANPEKLLRTLQRLGERRPEGLWKESLEEESYLKLYIRVVFDMLEKKDVRQNGECRDILKHILKAVVQNPKVSKRALHQLISGKMVHMLYTLVGRKGAHECRMVLTNGLPNCSSTAATKSSPRKCYLKLASHSSRTTPLTKPPESKTSLPSLKLFLHKSAKPYRARCRT